MSGEERRIAYEKAVIKFVNILLPQFIKTLDTHTRSMDNLSRSIKLMPTTIRTRPY